MTEDAGRLLVEQIVPRLHAGIRSSVTPIGAEDYEELIQDTIATAAMMLSSVEIAGKKVTPGNIAYYAILHTKSGRRSTGSSTVDIMAAGTQLSRRSTVYSLDEEIGHTDDFGDPVRLAEMLAGSFDDPATTAARNVDWSDVVNDVDRRQLHMIHDALRGRPIGLRFRKEGMTYESIRKIRQDLAGKIRARLGEDILSDVTRTPGWKAGLTAESEKIACKAERRYCKHS